MTARKANWHGMHWIRDDKRFAIYARDDFECVYCGSNDDLTVDHVLAEVLGGTNHESNLVTACTFCNSSKAHRSLRSWLMQLRERNIDTDGLARRIRSQTGKPLDRELGGRLHALREAA